MSDKQQRRPVVGSRTPSHAPRRLAGHTGRPEQHDDEHQHEDAPEPLAPEPVLTHSSASVHETLVDDRGVPLPRESGVLESPRTTVVLASLLGVLVLLGALLTAYLTLPDSKAWFWQDSASTERAPDPVRAGRPFVVPKEPVTIPLLQWREANQASMEAVKKILEVDWKTFDAHADEVRPLMTDAFAQKYVAAREDSREKFLSAKADYDIAIVGSSVVQARPTRVTSLLFLNQLVYKGEGKERVGPELYQVRVVVTVEKRDGRWIVDRLDAQ